MSSAFEAIQSVVNFLKSFGLNSVGENAEVIVDRENRMFFIEDLCDEAELEYTDMEKAEKLSLYELAEEVDLDDLEIVSDGVFEYGAIFS